MERIKMSITLPVKASELYDAWLDSKKHTAFTGGDAHMSKKVNREFTAWDEYISGKNLELKDGKFIKQSWRTMEFKDDAPDSTLELTFEEKAGKTKLSLYHYNSINYKQQTINNKLTECTKKHFPINASSTH